MTALSQCCAITLTGSLRVYLIVSKFYLKFILEEQYDVHILKDKKKSTKPMSFNLISPNLQVTCIESFLLIIND